MLSLHGNCFCSLKRVFTYSAGSGEVGSDKAGGGQLGRGGVDSGTPNLKLYSIIYKLWLWGKKGLRPLPQMP